MTDRSTGLLHEIANYYTQKLAEHGTTSRGVDWNSAESQVLRFEQLARIIRNWGFFSCSGANVQPTHAAIWPEYRLASRLRPV